MGLMGPLSEMGIEMDNRTERFAPRNDQSFQHLTDMQAQFGRDDAFIAIVKGDVFSDSFMERLQALHQELEAMDPAKDQAHSLCSVPLLVKRGTHVQPMTLQYALDKQIPFSGIKDGAKPYLRHLVSESGEWAVIFVQAPLMTPKESSEFAAQMTTLVNTHNRDGFNTLTGGIPVFVAELDGLTQAESNRLGGISMTLMLLLLGIQFRRASMILGPFLVMTLGITWTFGLMALSGLKMSYMTSILPGFLISVCVGDSIHIQALVQSELKRGVDVKSAIITAMKHAWLPMLFTTLTTAIGLYSFRFSVIPAVSELGTFGAIGVFVAFALSVCIIPICLSFCKVKPVGEVKPEPPLRGFLGVCSKWSHPKTGRIALVSAGILACAALYGASTLKTSHNPLSWLPTDGEIKRSMDVMDQEFGGASEFSIYLKSSDEKTLIEPQKLQAMYRIEQRILSHKTEEHGVQVQTSLSALNALRFSLSASGSPMTFDTLMADDEKLTLWLKMMDQNTPNWHVEFLSKDQLESRMRFRLPWQPAEKILDLKEFVVKESKTMESAEIKAQPVGTLFNLISTFGSLVQDLLQSFGIATGIILILMTIALKSVKLGAIAMLPNLLPVAFTMGSMAVLDIPFDMSTVLFASIILGICVDDTIHFLHHFQKQYDKTGLVDPAIEAALRHGGRAIVITSLLLAGCLGVYLMSEMLNLQRFGLLMILSVSFAVLSDLILLPMLLKACLSDKPSKKVDVQKKG